MLATENTKANDAGSRNGGQLISTPEQFMAPSAATALRGSFATSGRVRKSLGGFHFEQTMRPVALGDAGIR
jgi:hypothetical protein